jgi:hypothetical protein
MLPDLADNFPQYTQFGPMVPVHCVTPELGGCFHRFFDPGLNPESWSCPSEKVHAPLSLGLCRA